MIEQASLVIGEGNWAVKSDSLLGYKINNGKYYPREMSVVRATTGTRINEDGLVEVVPYNLVQYSQDFSNAYWTKNGATLVSGQADPFGGNNAVLFNNNSTTAFAYTPSGIVYSQATASVYAKYSSATSSMIFVDSSGAKVLYFNPQNGTIISTPSGYTSSITDVGNGWYRITLTGSINGATGFGTFGGGAVSTYFYGFQLVEGSSALDYLPTTDRLDVARIDYSSGSAALLVEPQRTNLFTYSSSFDNAAWTKVGVTITANATISPDGTQNADLCNTNNSTNHQLYKNITATGALSCSMYAKKNNARTFYLSVYNNNLVAYFDLDTASVTSIVGSGVTASIEDAGNGWYKCIMNFTNAPFEVHCGFLDSVYTGTSVEPFYISTAVNTSGYIWGAQLEAGSYATSYIPTQGSTVTRNADGNLTLITPQTLNDFVLFYDGLFFNDDAFVFGSGANSAWYVSITPSINRIVIDLASGRKYQAFNVNLVLNQRIKIAIKRASGVFDVFVNGVKLTAGIQVTDTTALSLVSVGWSFSSTYYTQGRINSAAAWQTALTDAQCQTLTTI